MFTSLTSLSASASTRCKKVGPSIHMLHGKSLAWNSRVARSAVLQSVNTCFHCLGLETSTIIADVPQYYATICEVKSIFAKSSCSLIVSTRSIAMTAAQSSSRCLLCPCVGSTFPFSRRNPTSCLSVSEKTLTHASADIASLHVSEKILSSDVDELAMENIQNILGILMTSSCWSELTLHYHGLMFYGH